MSCSGHTVNRPAVSVRKGSRSRWQERLRDGKALLSGIRDVFGLLFCKLKSFARPPSGGGGWMNFVECHLIPVATTIANQDSRCLSKGGSRSSSRRCLSTTPHHQALPEYRTHRVDHSTGGLVQTLDLLQITHHYRMLDDLSASRCIRPVSASSGLDKSGTRDLWAATIPTIFRT